MKDDTDQVVTSRVKFPDGIFHLEEQPGQRLINSEPEGAPGPLPLGYSQSTVKRIVEEVLVVVPIDKAVVKGRQKRDQHEQAEESPDQPRCAGPSLELVAGSARAFDLRPERAPRTLTFLAHPSSSTIFEITHQRLKALK